MATYNYLDKTGLGLVWGKIKTYIGNNFLSKTNTTSYTPTTDYHPATKKYVDDNVPTVPTKVSQLTNDSGFISSYTETDPIFTASAAHGITSTDISNWNNKTSNTGTITKIQTTAGAHTTINVSSGSAAFNVPTKTSHLTNDSGFITNAGVTGVKGNAESSYRTGQVNLTAANIGAAPTSHTHSANDLDGGYINIHPENSPIIIPFIHNDIAHLLKRGGSAIITYDGTNKNVDLTNCFDGSGSYWSIANVNVSTIVIELTLHRTFTYGNTAYIDFGNVGWRTRGVKIEVMNSAYSNDTWTVKLNTTTNEAGHITANVAHQPSGASNTGGGFNKIKFTFSDFASKSGSNINFRIAQLGIYNYGSSGLRETYMSRGSDDPIFRSITPYANNTYSLGASSNKWANVYATTFTGNLTGNVTGNVSGSAGSVAWSGVGSKPTTLAGYGITDAKIASGVITLGSNTITPLTSSSTLNATKLSGAIPSAVTATTQASTDNSTKIATTAYVTTAIANLPEPMIFKGSVGTGGTITTLPTAAAVNEGWTYKVITTLSSPSAKVGDTVISNGSEWVVIPSGDEPSGTVTSVGISNATNGGLTISGSPITSSGTITVGHSNVLSSAQTTQAVYPIKIDKNGHISAYGSAQTILSLGTSSSTAFRGDYGNSAYAHAVTNKGSAFSSGFYKITTNSEGHVTGATAVKKSDITGLGIPAQDTTYTFDGTYNASTNKAATVSTVNNALVNTALTGTTTAESIYTDELTSGNLIVNGGASFVNTISVGSAPTSDMNVATKKYVDDSTASTFYINITLSWQGSNPVYTSDKTFSQIETAFEAGKNCIVLLTTDYTEVLQLLIYDEYNGFYFGNETSCILISTENSISSSSNYLQLTYNGSNDTWTSNIAPRMFEPTNGKTWVSINDGQYQSVCSATLTTDISGLTTTKKLTFAYQGQFYHLISTNGTTWTKDNTIVDSYSLALSNNVIQLKNDNTVISSITLPIYNGGVSS